VTVSWTTDTLVDKIRRRASLPDAGTPTDQEILDVATEELLSRFVPFVRSCRENYGVKTTTQTLVVGTSDYRIPSDAQGATLRLVTLVDSAGNERDIDQVPIQYDQFSSTNGTPRGFCVIDDMVRLIPTPDRADTLRLLYYRRPSALVPVASCFPVASKTDTTVVVTGTPSWASGTPIDVVQALPHFTTLLDDNAATLATSTFTVADSASTSAVAVGDYVCLHMETCIPGIPAELHAALVSATAAQLLVEEGDAQGAAMEMSNAERIMNAARATLTPRVDGAPRLIVSSNSPLRSRRRRYGENSA
jgi:hypothetical protein